MAYKLTIKYDPNQPRAPAGAPGGGQWIRLYHLTDDPNFVPNPRFAPEDNTVSINDRSGREGIYLTDDAERWVNGHGYMRPFVAEIAVDPAVVQQERWGSEVFVPGEHFDKINVVRVIPLDAHAREVFGQYGWVESTNGVAFDTGKPITTPDWEYPFRGWKYPGDTRNMDRKEVAALLKQFEKGRKLRAKKYDPNQPRVPKGNPDGGQFAPKDFNPTFSQQVGGFAYAPDGFQHDFPEPAGEFPTLDEEAIKKRYLKDILNPDRITEDSMIADHRFHDIPRAAVVAHEGLMQDSVNWRFNELTIDEMRAVSSYQGSWYDQINKYMRGDPLATDISTVGAMATDLNLALLKAPRIPEGTILYRSFRSEDIHSYALPGHIFRDPAFGSTTVNSDFVGRWSDDKMDRPWKVVTRMRVPDNFQAAYLGSRISTHKSPYEYEVLLPPRSTFKVRARREVEDGYNQPVVILDVDLLPNISGSG